MPATTRSKNVSIVNTYTEALNSITFCCLYRYSIYCVLCNIMHSSAFYPQCSLSKVYIMQGLKLFITDLTLYFLPYLLHRVGIGLQAIVCTVFFHPILFCQPAFSCLFIVLFFGGLTLSCIYYSIVMCCIIVLK